MRKTKQRVAIRQRLDSAVKGMYHNAKLSFPRNMSDYEADLFNSWLEVTVRHEIDYVQSGGAYSDIQKTCEFIRSQYNSAKAGIYASKKYLRQCSLERAKPSAAWECISEFGKLYTIGRGGATLIPEEFMTLIPEEFIGSTNAATFSAIESVTRAIRIIESFNEFVRSWCAGVPDLWNEHKRETGLDMDIQAEPVRRRILESYNPMPTTDCDQCGREHKNEIGRFCSVKCQQEYHGLVL